MSIITHVICRDCRKLSPVRRNSLQQHWRICDPCFRKLQVGQEAPKKPETSAIPSGFLTPPPPPKKAA
ncbi:hypothetical protein L0156_21420 [bacterium]|nr:hypothetical protein [bacterium]